MTGGFDVDKNLKVRSTAALKLKAAIVVEVRAGTGLQVTSEKTLE